ncbi:MAG: AAA family ATPase [Gammaproteobacteria bacterium]
MHPGKPPERGVGPALFEPVRAHLYSRIIGQRALIDSMLVCLLSEGHMLIEGVPGLAKTTAVKSLGEALEGDFQRIQFTPDLLPSDLIGTDIYRQEKGEFVFRPGPLFHNILLADEVNRAPAKVQSALLEAMGERQITVGHRTYALPRLFMVLATQNPIEQEGTYQLPEAQLDRFLLHVWVGYPSRDEELAILDLDGERRRTPSALSNGILSQAELFAAQHAVAEIYLDRRVLRYIVDLVLASREPTAYDDELGRCLRYGASPRASIALARCARALAWLQGKDYVAPEHVQRMAPEVLRHRLLLTFEAEAEGMTSDDIVRRLLDVVAVP